MKKYTTIGFHKGKKHQQSTNDMKLAIDRLANYSKGYVRINLENNKNFIFRRKGVRK